MNWEDPQPKVYEAYRWGKIVEELKKNPGRWAHHPRRTNKSTGAHMKRKYPGLETTLRNIHKDDDGKLRADLYYRWTGVK